MYDEKWTFIIGDESTKCLSALEEEMNRFLNVAASTAYSMEDLAAAFELMAQSGMDISLEAALKLLVELYEDKVSDEPREALPRPPRKLLPIHKKTHVPKIRACARSRLRK